MTTFPFEMDEIIDNITEMIRWYRESSKSATINELLDFQDHLSAYIASLTELYAEYSRGYNLTYIQRKYTFAVEQMAHRNRNNTVSDSDSWAETKTKELRKKEVLNYEIAQKISMLRQDARVIIQTCMQRISFLKLEYEYSHNLNRT